MTCLHKRDVRDIEQTEHEDDLRDVALIQAGPGNLFGVQGDDRSANVVDQMISSVMIKEVSEPEPESEALIYLTEKRG
jgi:hypothetical protein